MPSGTAIHPDDESNTRNEWNQRARTFQNFTEENQCGIAFGCCIFFVLLISIITGILYVSLMDSLTNEDNSIMSDGSTNQTITNEKNL